MSNKNKKTNGVITLASLAVILGLLAGVAGQLIAREYLFKNWYALPFGGEVNLSRTGLNNSNLVIKGAKNISVKQEKKVRETIDSASQNLVGIFPQKKELISSEEKLKDINIQNYYNLNDYAGQGFIITSDGWILAPQVDGLQTEADLEQFVAITQKREIYEIDAKKEVSGSSFVFLHLKKAQELPVRKLTSEKEMQAGELVLAMNWKEQGFLTSIAGKQQDNGLVRSSDFFREDIQLADSIPVNFKPSFLFNLKGSIVGVYNGPETIRSINNFRVHIQNLLKNKTDTFPALGVNYVDLSRVLLASDKYEKGALIYPNENGVAVEKGSVAATHGLQKGDIITAVNNKKIDKNTSLNYLISGYTVGDNITLTYLREGQSHTISLNLKGEKR